MQKSGNNTLFLLVGLLIVVLLGLIYIGSMRESAVEQLIEGAGPDSSAFVQENSNTLLEKQSEIQTIEKAEPEPEPIDLEPVQAPAPDSSISGSPSQPIEKIDIKKVQDSGSEKIYFYTIRKGDTMYKIAAKFGNKPDDILSLNGLTDMGLQADKEIKVKIKALHSVQEGEGLNAVAEKYSVPGKSIKIANGLSSDNLPSGGELIIPLK